MLTRKDAIKVAAELNLPEVIRRLARGETLESRLNTHWGNAEEFFISASKSPEPIWDNKILPLWDDGNFDELFCVHLPTKKFIEFYIEEDVNPLNLPLWNYQQILLPTFHGIYECYIDDGEEKCHQELIYQAELFEFKYVKEIMEIGSRNWNDYEKQEKELSAFRETIK